MQTWNLGREAPLCLTLAADARLSNPDYTNDHIWELSLEGGEPPALVLQTSFGLRAGWLRLFPRFVRGGSGLTNPASFAVPPALQQFYPNFLSLAYSPFPGIDVRAEYWVPGSQMMAGRLVITNESVLKENLRVEWAALLNPLGQGASMAVQQTGSGYVLAGKTEDLRPVCMLLGVVTPVQSPFPALAVDLELFPGNSRTIIWALSALKDEEASISQARLAATAPWEGEVARIEMTAQHHSLQIETGNPDWDAAFAFAQKTALGLFFPASQHLPQPSFVNNRLPEQGHSARGDGSDHPHQWSGQTALDAWYLSSLILPGGVALAEGVLRNFLAVQDDSGAIDWRPGLAGQRGRHLSSPLLAALAWRIDCCKDDHAWLSDIYPALLRFVKAWLDGSHDRDKDDFPEWDHPLQTGYEDNPLYDRWDAHSQGVNIHAVESPALPALLFNEINCLVKIARRMEHLDDLPWLEEQAARLRAAVETTWDASAFTYRFRDYQTHHCPRGAMVRSFQGSGALEPRHHFREPQRLLIRIQAQDENTRTVRLTLFGETPAGVEAETLSPLQFFWTGQIGRATTTKTWLSLERVEVEGLNPRDRGWLNTIDFSMEAISLLVPLWAGIPAADRAAELIDHTLLARYLDVFGIPMCPATPHIEGAANLAYIYMSWNQMIGEALLGYGRREQAAELLTRLMNAVLPVLKQQHAFRQYYHAQTGQPAGERNILGGLPPLGLFLRVCGIDRISPTEICLSGFNPFPAPITVQYRGVRITRQEQNTRVTYPNGQAVLLEGSGPYRINLS